MTSPCGLGFLTAWQPQGTQLLTWCKVKGDYCKRPDGNGISFYDQASELTWCSFRCGQEPSQVGGVSKSRCTRGTWTG